MTHYILFNPLAGHGDISQAAWVKALSDAGETVVRQDITTLADRAAYEVFLADLAADDRLILCGGDGTINRFVNATEGLDVPQEIFYFASGTGNDFLHDLGMADSGKQTPFSIKEYLQNLPTVEVQGKTYRFLNNVGFGIDGYCCEVGDAQKAANEGNPKAKPVNYTAIAIKGLLFHFKPVHATVTVDGVTHEYRKVWLSPAMKGRYYGGGMMPTPAQDRNAASGELSVMLMHGAGKLHTLMVFPSIFKGEHIKHEKMVAIHKGHDIHVTFDRPTALQIDGETILGVTEYRARA